MNGKVLSHALSGLPEDLIAEAMAPARKSRTIPWLRIAVCFAAVLAVAVLIFPTSNDIVTAPGILAITVYALDDTTGFGYKEVILEEGIDTGFQNVWPLGLNILPGIPVQISLDSEDFPADAITYAIHADQGVYLDMTDGIITKLANPVIRQNPTSCYWVPFWDSEEVTENADEDSGTEYKQVYTDIVIYCEERVIGYAVLLFEQDLNHSGMYNISMVSSVLFPKENETYQYISEDYVSKCIDSIKQEQKG